MPNSWSAGAGGSGLTPGLPFKKPTNDNMVSNKKKCPNCPQVMPCATKEAGPEGLMEEVELEGPAVETEGLMEEAAGLLEKVGLESPAVEAEGLVEEADEIHLSKKEAEMDKSKKKQKNCSYHTGLGVYPIRSALKERVRKGQTELLIDWEPCATCGKQWTPTWEPKESFV
ncbi:early nodulin 2 [Labeo rohita]|uniref:Early nodulin 2 n=1 Tax=Labeo rohita TaxID=84645 RepID=A0A498M4D2_LABRO|nr:early nodulin 2 [Labeo rohita]